MPDKVGAEGGQGREMAVLKYVGYGGGEIYD